MLANLVDLGIGLLLALVLLIVFGVTARPGSCWRSRRWSSLIVLTALGVSVWLSALDVQYRDVRYAVPFLLQVWLFATPVIYAAADVPERWRPILRA